MSVSIIVPKGFFGASKYDDELDTMLREIAVATSPDPAKEWAEKYGTNFENEVFMMHQFCWCEQDDCPWCTGCDCPDEAWHWLIDGKEVTHEEWVDFFKQRVEGLKVESPEYERAADEADSHRSVLKEDVCDFCKGTGPAALKGGEPGKSAPNFWYKPTNFKVWWYKFIGRGVETNRVVTPDELKAIKTHCIASTGK